MEAKASEDTHRAACRAAGRAVAAALLGFTIKSITIYSACEEAGILGPRAAMALKESNATFEEKALMDLAGTWAELEVIDCAGQSPEAKKRILGSFQHLYPSIDPHKTRYGLTTLIDGYGDSVRALAEELHRVKSMSGSVCGKLIVAHRGGTRRPIM